MNEEEPKGVTGLTRGDTTLLSQGLEDRDSEDVENLAPLAAPTEDKKPNLASPIAGDVNDVKEDEDAPRQIERTNTGLSTRPIKKDPVLAKEKLIEGYNLFNGIDFRTIDREKGRKLIQKAAQLGNQCARGMCFHQGCVSGGMNLQKATQYYLKAAKKNDPLAQVQLGNCYHLGHGVEKSFSQAVKWYRLSAQANHATGQRCLGSCYQFGHGVSVDRKRALIWYMKAAAQGHCVAEYSLGYCYEHGVGIQKDLDKAIRFHALSAAQGYHYASEDLENLLKDYEQNDDADELLATIKEIQASLPKTEEEKKKVYDELMAEAKELEETLPRETNLDAGTPPAQIAT